MDITTIIVIITFLVNVGLLTELYRRVGALEGKISILLRLFDPPEHEEEGSNLKTPEK